MATLKQRDSALLTMAAQLALANMRYQLSRLTYELLSKGRNLMLRRHRDYVDLHLSVSERLGDYVHIINIRSAFHIYQNLSFN